LKSDQDLARWWEGYRLTKNQDDWDKLTVALQPALYRTCLFELRNPEWAKDALQATWVLLLERRPKFRHDGQLLSWCFQTARLVCANLRRYESRRQTQEMDMIEQNSMPGDTSPEDQWALQEGISRLSKADREVILLRYFQGLSVEEVSKRLGVSVAAAQMRISRAVDRLRKRLGKSGLPMTALAVVALLENGSVAHAATPFVLGAEVSARVAAVTKMTSSAKTVAALVHGATICAATAGTAALIGIGYHRAAPPDWPGARLEADPVATTRMFGSYLGTYTGTFRWVNLFDSRKRKINVRVSIAQSLGGGRVDFFSISGPDLQEQMSISMHQRPGFAFNDAGRVFRVKQIPQGLVFTGTTEEIEPGNPRIKKLVPMENRLEWKGKNLWITSRAGSPLAFRSEYILERN